MDVWSHTNSAHVPCTCDHPHHGTPGSRKRCLGDSRALLCCCSTRACTQPVLQATCLKPTYTLRRQLMTSYGATCLLSMGVCVILGCTCALMAGQRVQDHARSTLQAQVTASIRVTAQYSTDTVTERLKRIQGTSALVAEFLQDRMAGYPYREFVLDELVPFVDGTTGRNRYPLASEFHDRVALDWNLSTDYITNQNVQEHAQERSDLFRDLQYHMSTRQGSLVFQGTCNPNATVQDIKDIHNRTVRQIVPWDYWPNCTEANNDITTGGVMAPTNTTFGLATKAADLTVLLKPLYESEPNVRAFVISFHNHGAGATYLFPGVAYSVTSGYTSIGCDWMSAPNPHRPQEPIGTPEEIAKCHPNGTWVDNRNYNPMERAFCMAQALQPDQFHFYGPYQAGTGSEQDLVQPWLFSYGKAVYDRVTGKLLACTAIELDFEALAESVTQGGKSQMDHDEGSDSTTINVNYSGGHDHDGDRLKQWTSAALVKADGTILHGAGWMHDQVNYTMHIAESAWLNAEEWERLTQQHNHDRKIIQTHAGDIVTAYPIPPYSHVPDLWVVYYIGNPVFAVIDTMDQEIRGEVLTLVRNVLLVGVIGAALLLTMVALVSRWLTQPLLSIESVAWRIVNHSAHDATDGETNDNNNSIRPWSRFLVDESATSSRSLNSTTAAAASVSDKRRRKKGSSPLRPPRTEINELVREFNKMISGFSGVGASTVATSAVHEIPNRMQWQEEFMELYQHQLQPSRIPKRPSLVWYDDCRAAPKLKDRSGDSAASFTNVSRQQEPHEEAAQELEEQQPQSLSASANHLSIKADSTDAPAVAPNRGVPSSSASTSTSSLSSSNEPTTACVFVETKSARGAKPTTELISDRADTAAADDSEGDFGQYQESSPNDPYALGTDNDTDKQECYPSSMLDDQNDSTKEQSPGLMSLREAPQRLNVGRNTEQGIMGGHPPNCEGLLPAQDKHRFLGIFRSPLFRWIVILIVIPQVVTNFLIWGITTHSIIVTLPSWVEIAQDRLWDVSEDSVRAAAVQRAALAEAVLAEPLRNLHVLTRMAGWLLFSAVQRSSSFPSVKETTEECKTAGDAVCPDPNLNQCPCEWKDVWHPEAECRYFGEMEARRVQQSSFFVSANDADPLTGNRDNSSSFPALDYSPETTRWWNDPERLPGSWKGANASGYESTYDRLRVISALSTALFPVYNYMNRLNMEKKHFLSGAMSFESDGMMWFFKGCDFFSNMATWSSTEENGAAQLRPSLCPIGKFGYDPRCRGWYATGRQLALEDGMPVYIAPPYRFGVEDVTETSATSPIIDPRSGTYVGQTLLDFRLEAMIPALERETNALFTCLITPSEDFKSGGDTVIGPNATVGSDAAYIVDLVMPNDEPSSDNYRRFEDIVKNMKLGKSGQESFVRTTVEGLEERLVFAYAPVMARSLKPVRADDFTRGCTVAEDLVYSVGVAELEETVRLPYATIEEEVGATVRDVEVVYFVVCLFFTLACTFLTCQISVVVVKPVLVLLKVVKNINAGRINDDLPELEGGSTESNKVHVSFAKLFKIIRVSNSAFFTGNLEWAYHFVSDALRLFRKINDCKAVGIASNNIANIMFAIALDQTEKCPDNDACVLLNDECCVKTAPRRYDDAVALAEEELGNCASAEFKNECRQQLADRLFNRAMFLLRLSDDRCASSFARPQGLADLAKALALDADVRDYWYSNNLTMQRSDSYFDRLLRRISGLAFLLRHDRSIEAVWNIQVLVGEADQLLYAAWEQPKLPLFRELGRIGRLQQLESTLISLELAMGQEERAAKLGMRMLVEDDYLIDFSFVASAEALIRFMNDEKCSSQWSLDTVSKTKASIRKMLKFCKNTSLDAGKAVVFVFDVSDSVTDEYLFAELRENSLLLYDEYVNRGDMVGFAGGGRHYDGRELVLEPKGDDWRDRQRKLLANAATVRRRRNVDAPVFPMKKSLISQVKSIMSGSRACDDMKTFILHITDTISLEKEAHRSSFLGFHSEQQDKSKAQVITIALDGSHTTAKRQPSMSAVSTRHEQVLTCHSKDTMDQCFETAVFLICGNVSSSSGIGSGGIQHGLTMEKF